MQKKYRPLIQLNGLEKLLGNYGEGSVRDPDAPWKNCSKNGDVFCTNSHQSLPRTRSAVDAQSFFK